MGVSVPASVPASAPRRPAAGARAARPRRPASGAATAARAGRAADARATAGPAQAGARVDARVIAAVAAAIERRVRDQLQDELQHLGCLASRHRDRRDLRDGGPAVRRARGDDLDLTRDVGRNQKPDVERRRAAGPVELGLFDRRGRSLRRAHLHRRQARHATRQREVHAHVRTARLLATGSAISARPASTAARLDGSTRAIICTPPGIARSVDLLGEQARGGRAAHAGRDDAADDRPEPPARVDGRRFWAGGGRRRARAEIERGRRLRLDRTPRSTITTCAGAGARSGGAAAPAGGALANATFASAPAAPCLLLACVFLSSSISPM